MNVHPAKAAFIALAQQGNVIPVYADLVADFETPVSAYAKLKDAGPAYLLESVEGGENVNRYSFIGCRPRLVYACGPATTEIRRPGRPVERVPTPRDPLTLIQREIAGYRPVTLPGMPRFMGGAVGYIGYEYVTRIEPTVPVAPADELKIPLIYFMLSDTLVIFDRVKQTLRLCVNAHIGDAGGAGQAHDAAVAELASLYALLRRPRELVPAPLVETPPGPVPPGNFTRPAFERMVEGIKEYIRAGDVIQVVPSQRFTQPFTQNPLDLYRALRSVNPSPYMFILDAGDFALVGASPEVHVRLTGDLVEIRPPARRDRGRGPRPGEGTARR